MTKRVSTKPNNEQNTAQLQQGFTLERQEEQSIYLEPFYERLMGTTFAESTAAIEHCRDLCAEFGFTVKQEASTHRNIYVYCSREGLPDSLRNPKTNPQRKRPSKRCDCRWRVVLYENEGRWEFRKSLNPEAGKHNHELMRPDEIERSWPKEVTDLIFELARLRMTTQDIRTRVQAQFPNINWNERRFYNRLSEERQKIKLRDTTERTHDLCQIWSKICTLTAGNDELSQFIKHELTALYQTLCETTQIDITTLPVPTVFSDDGSEVREDMTEDNSSISPTSSSRRSSKQSGSNAPKGFLPVEIPKQTYYIKVHNQRVIQEAQLIRSQRRSRTLSDEAQLYMLQPPRKMSRKGKDRESMVTEDKLMPDHIFQLNHPPPPHPHHYSRATNSTPGTPTNNSHVPILTAPPPTHTQQQQQRSSRQPIHVSSFVYTYDSNNMSLDSPIPGYHPQFSNAYHMNATPSPTSFNEMQFGFDQPIVRTNEPSNNVPSMASKNIAQPACSYGQTTTTTATAPTQPDTTHQIYTMNHPVSKSSARMYEQDMSNRNNAYHHNMYMRPPNNVIPMYNQPPPSQQQETDGSRI
ncbi:hypothetical protein G6F46_004335 [Rhizopus delemar]|uniref:FAR1 domain-containing protein n=2 Tax=Rhizopus TaxID=4842 RepID=A0A9P6Z5L8_9FUNG|nr:hypothetical protein G6F43_000513 [Rhizopus delemar]KAG1545973.1 hypothetical protein G6F51_005148 [Rhizopus arrhizus]KAG1462347.1 hypothetical protein G6F55_003021 [Rhizopus delemar]KAG1504887.1 hypothetical protein G6F54_000698 [Rhizopus delemar]KAG1511815.1 hypothetical protein G6F52_010561 [Rhizopus delemar]